jgi:hypothetical protein
MRSRRAVSLPVETPTTGVVPAPSSGSIPPAVVVVVGVVEGSEYPPCGDDDLFDPPQPATASSAAVPTPMERSLPMDGAYSGLVRENRACSSRTAFRSLAVANSRLPPPLDQINAPLLLLAQDLPER